MNLIIALLLNAVALIVTAALPIGFHVNGFKTAIVAAIVLGLINTFIKPILKFLTAPLNLLTLGLFSFVVNGIVLWLVASLIPGNRVTIDSAWSAILAAIVLAVVSTALSTLVSDIGMVGKKKR